MKKRILVIILFLFVNLLFGQEFTDLYGDYLGQTPPGDSAVVFAPGIVSTDGMEHSPAVFSPDGNEVYWITVQNPGTENSRLFNGIMTRKCADCPWSHPKSLPYSIGGISTDGHFGYYWLFEDKETWVVEKVDSTWGNPKCLNLVKRYPELKLAAGASLTNSGVFYFTGKSEGLGTQNNTAIYRTEMVNGEYVEPQLLPNNINLSSFHNWTPFIAPDESYLIFSSNRHNQSDGGDLYISFHDKNSDEWSEPINMGDKINTEAQERIPWVSFDGKYLFFTRWTREHNHDVYWVSAEIINRLRGQENMLK